MWVLCLYPFLLSMIYTINGMQAASHNGMHELPWRLPAPSHNGMQAESHGKCSDICNGLDLDDCQHESVRKQCPDLCSAAHCNKHCQYGVCTEDFTCECNASFEGPRCMAGPLICYSLNRGDCKEKIVRDNCRQLCSAEGCKATCKNGVCSSSFTCDCDQGFQGPNCDIPVVRNLMASVHGVADCQWPWIYVHHNLTTTCIQKLPRKHMTTNIWENARKACQEIGGDLPKFTSYDQIYGLYDYLNKWRQAVHVGNFEHWIRGYRTSEGKSYWADDNTEIPLDLFSKQGYHERKIYNKAGDRGPRPTTIEKECLVFRPQPANSNEKNVGIFNDGKMACDKQTRETAYTATMCQKWVE